MENSRRDFLKLSGLSGLGLAGSGLLHCSKREDQEDIAVVSRRREKAHIQRFNMSGFAAPPLEIVRVAIIGTGQRGPAYVRNLKHIEG
ncbi:twin-arginine translocation signal domain-containing protein, partial [bacterium]|nr:twin-arginine translocation signal domain-containing protein [bacterium]